MEAQKGWSASSTEVADAIEEITQLVVEDMSYLAARLSRQTPR
jgi:hypothetical protein